MAIFSYLKDATSGKIKKQNELINANISKLLEKVSTLEGPNLIKDWITIFSLIAGAFLEELLFQKTEPIQFGKYIKELDEEKAFEIFKIIGGYYLHAFLRNKDASVILQQANIDEEEFKKTIMTITDYDQKDREEYESLVKISDDDWTSYFTRLHEKVWENGYGIRVEGKQDIHEIYYFGKFLGKSFLDSFMPEIAKAPFIKKIIDQRGDNY